jgi:YD repeat-containing protein
MLFLVVFLLFIFFLTLFYFFSRFLTSDPFLISPFFVFFCMFFSFCTYFRKVYKLEMTWVYCTQMGPTRVTNGIRYNELWTLLGTTARHESTRWSYDETGKVTYWLLTIKRSNNECGS